MYEVKVPSDHPRAPPLRSKKTDTQSEEAEVGALDHRGRVVVEETVVLPDCGDGVLANVGHGVIEVAHGYVGAFVEGISLVFLGHALMYMGVPLLQFCPDVGYLVSAVVYVVAGLWGVGVEEGCQVKPSHLRNRTQAAPICIDVCYSDPTTIIRTQAGCSPLPLGPPGYRPLHLRLSIPKVPSNPPCQRAWSISPSAVGGWLSSAWGCCWKPQAMAAVRMALSRSVSSCWLRRARSMPLWYWDRACLSCSGGIFRGGGGQALVCIPPGKKSPSPNPPPDGARAGEKGPYDPGPPPPGHCQPPPTPTTGHHILQGRRHHPPRTPDGTGCEVRPPRPQYPRARPSTGAPGNLTPYIPQTTKQTNATGTKGPPCRPGRAFMCTSSTTSASQGDVVSTKAWGKDGN